MSVLRVARSEYREQVMSEPTESIVPADYLHDDVQAVAQYRSVSSLAVLSAVLGVGSLLALVSEVLLVVPLLGIVCAVLALRRIATSEEQLAGRGAALVGLALSLAVGSGVYVRDVVRDRLIAAEAKQWGLEWCELLLDGQLLTALELKNPPESRRTFDDSLAEYYETNEVAAEAFQEFKDDPVVALLSDAPEGARVEPGKLVGIERNGRGGYLAAQEFIFVLPDDADQKFNIFLTRSRLGGVWHVTDHRPSE